MGPRLTTERQRGWVVPARALLFIAATVVVLMVSTPLALMLPVRPEAAGIGAFASVATLALTLLFVRWDGLRLGDAGAAPRRESAGRLLVGFLLGAVLIAVHSALLSAVGHVEWRRARGVTAGEIAVALAMYLLLSAREELAFHGYPLRRLVSVWGVWPAQAVIAMTFALEHVLGGWSWTNALSGAAVGSLLFGMAAIATRGLAVPIGLHAAWNVGDALRGGKDANGVWRAVVAGGFGRSAEIASIVSYLGLFAVATAGFWWWSRRAASGPGTLGTGRWWPGDAVPPLLEAQPRPAAQLPLDDLHRHDQEIGEHREV